MRDFIFIYITCPTEAEARKIAKHLLSRKLIACANIYPGVINLYPWQGKLVDEAGYVLIAKTTEQNYASAITEVEKIHSDATPCIIKIPIVANEQYGQWLLDQLR